LLLYESLAYIGFEQEAEKPVEVQLSAELYDVILNIFESEVMGCFPEYLGDCSTKHNQNGDNALARA
jgi:hypothetical protein